MSGSISTAPRNSIEWRSFLEWPADYAEPRRLAECFEGTIGEDACERMLRTQRLGPRLSALLLDHYRLDASMPEVEELDATIALSSAEQLEQTALRAGAIYWSDSFAGSILGHTTAALHEQLGEALCTFAMKHRDLAGPAQPLDPLDGIRDRVFADGWRCIGAWCHAAPASMGRRVLLKLPPDDLVDRLPDAPFADTGTAIVRRAAGTA
ncbi:SctK family type III secretion system sorting platform protein [Mesorhizobium sp.]|uniref:SctK family type III secretion system sorting platform protein n=1 Tax=Mesorhizobium sp. TaxID=1871066 RepID=UPI00122663D4|nr:SctK family type III secretion system sorting platform protein [Mesorhizobium sp.]TIO09358.1 MAG: hypothetical protein E5X88_08265 [Mesorhizobium sp.]TIO33266.1 MAG: hypothetical protein E5X89_15895 [Mesorhizobium sp.]